MLLVLSPVTSDLQCNPASSHLTPSMENSNFTPYIYIYIYIYIYNNLNIYKRTQTDINQHEIEIAHSFIYSQLSQFNKLTPVSYDCLSSY